METSKENKYNTEEDKSEEPTERNLTSELRVISQPADGDCLFNSVISAAKLNPEIFSKLESNIGLNPTEMRKKLAEIIEYQDDSFDNESFERYTREEYAEALRNNLWGGQHELQILADKCGLNIVIRDLENSRENIIRPCWANKENHYPFLNLAYNGNSHYDAVIISECNPDSDKAFEEEPINIEKSSKLLRQKIKNKNSKNKLEQRKLDGLTIEKTHKALDELLSSWEKHSEEKDKYYLKIIFKIMDLESLYGGKEEVAKVCLRRAKESEVTILEKAHNFKEKCEDYLIKNYEDAANIKSNEGEQESNEDKNKQIFEENKQLLENKREFYQEQKKYLEELLSVCNKVLREGESQENKEESKRTIQEKSLSLQTQINNLDKIIELYNKCKIDKENSEIRFEGNLEEEQVWERLESNDISLDDENFFEKLRSMNNQEIDEDMLIGENFEEIY